jgi:hypothetical protein
LGEKASYNHGIGTDGRIAWYGGSGEPFGVTTATTTGTSADLMEYAILATAPCGKRRSLGGLVRKISYF